jgi:hypothetical protein
MCLCVHFRNSSKLSKRLFILQPGVVVNGASKLHMKTHPPILYPVYISHKLTEHQEDLAVLSPTESNGPVSHWHLTVPYGGWQDARLESMFIQKGMGVIKAIKSYRAPLICQTGASATE